MLTLDISFRWKAASYAPTLFLTRQCEHSLVFNLSFFLVRRWSSRRRLPRSAPCGGPWRSAAPGPPARPRAAHSLVRARCGAATLPRSAPSLVRPATESTPTLCRVSADSLSACSKDVLTT